MDIIVQELEKYFAELYTRTVNLTPVLPTFAEILASSFDENFLQGGRWDGNSSNTTLFSGGSQRWNGLAASTREHYLDVGYSQNRTLRRTAGGMANTVEVRPQGALSIAISVKKPYAAIQNFGGIVNPIIPVTRAMRKYFWARFYETHEEKYKYMALTKKTTFNPKIILPPSPFIVIQQVDVEDALDVIQQYLAAGA